MFPYLVVTFFVIVWIYLEEKATHRKSFWTTLLLLSLLESIRSSTVGTDTWKYLLDFTNETPVYNIDFNPYVEPGFQIVKLAILSFTHNYFWLLFIVALIMNSCYLFIMRKHSANYLLSVFFYITLGLYTFSFNGMRQGIAMGIFILAIPYLLDKKLMPYILLIVLASLFHRSALVMIPIYFLLNINIKNIYKLIIGFTVSLLTSASVISYLAANNPRYRVYAEEVDNAGGYFTLTFYSLIAIALFLLKNKYKITDTYFNKTLTLYNIGILVVIPLTLLKTDPSGPQRILFYFTSLLILLLPFALKKLNNVFFYASAIIISIVYFVLTTSRFGNITPYTINPIFKIF